MVRETSPCMPISFDQPVKTHMMGVSLLAKDIRWAVCFFFLFTTIGSNQSDSLALRFCCSRETMSALRFPEQGAARQ